MGKNPDDYNEQAGAAQVPPVQTPEAQLPDPLQACPSAQVGLQLGGPASAATSA